MDQPGPRRPHPGDRNGTFGLATIRRQHVVCGHGELAFEYPAKGAIQREQAVAAVGLAVSERAESDSARKRAIARVVQEVAGYLGNTPAVARSSYIDPRVIESYQGGATIALTLGDLGASSQFGELATEGRPEAAVLRLLRDARRAGS